MNNRKTLIAVAVLVAVVAVAIPTCQMVGCNMKTGAVMPWGNHALPGFFSTCGGTYVFNSAPSAVVPAGTDSLLVVLVAAFIAAAALVVPRTEAHFVLARTGAPPPPPEDPLGARFRV